MATPVPPPFNAVSYHINVAAGDAAIHVLEGPKSATDKTITCHHAVLIDGGVHDSKETPLLSAINKLQKHYGEFKFDAIVITHWDADHSFGIVNLLRTGFDKQYITAPAPKPSTAQMSEFRSQYLKYRADGKPLSTLYAPYWGGPGGKLPSRLRKNKAHSKYLTARKYSKGYVLDVDCGIFEVKTVCHLCCTTDKYIGRELFSGASLGSVFGSPKALRVAYNDLKIPLSRSPGLFIIGGDTVTIAAKPNTASPMTDALDGRVLFLIPLPRSPPQRRSFDH